MESQKDQWYIENCDAQDLHRNNIVLRDVEWLRSFKMRLKEIRNCSPTWRLSSADQT